MARRPALDQELAASFVGKHLLIGLTIYSHDDVLLGQQQLHGDILRINLEEGVVVRLAGSGEEYRLPPDLRSFKVAAPGTYRLHSTGELVVDPDLISSWILHKPPLH